MRENYMRRAKACGVLAFCVLACLRSAWVYAADEGAPALNPASVPERQVRLPAFKVGGLRGGDVILITDSGAERVKATALAQQWVAKPSALSDFCRGR